MRLIYFLPFTWNSACQVKATCQSTLQTECKGTWEGRKSAIKHIRRFHLLISISRYIKESDALGHWTNNHVRGGCPVGKAEEAALDEIQKEGAEADELE